MGRRRCSPAELITITPASKPREAELSLLLLKWASQKLLMLMKNIAATMSIKLCKYVWFSVMCVCRSSFDSGTMRMSTIINRSSIRGFLQKHENAPDDADLRIDDESSEYSGTLKFTSPRFIYLVPLCKFF